jgi:hypothetical protein
LTFRHVENCLRNEENLKNYDELFTFYFFLSFCLEKKQTPLCLEGLREVKICFRLGENLPVTKNANSPTLVGLWGGQKMLLASKKYKLPSVWRSWGRSKYASFTKPTFLFRKNTNSPPFGGVGGGQKMLLLRQFK